MTTDRWTPAGEPVEHPDAALIEAWLDRARARLLDLTKRNRALNFKIARVSTVTAVGERSPEVFRRLVLEGKPMKFRPGAEAPPQPPLLSAAETGTDGLDAFEEIDVAAGDAFEPYDAARLEDRHTDAWLETAKPPDRLDASLRRLEEMARLSLEEQGVNPLFLALGMLEYTESRDSAETLCAPLVLVPVTLERTGARAPYTVAASDDAITNPSLTEYLRNFRVELPQLPDAENIPDGYDLQDLFTEVARAISSQPGWSLRDEIHLGLFNFTKFVMFKDLERNRASFGRHRLVRRLVTRKGDQYIELPDEIRSLDLDTECPPEALHQVVDADSSQMRAIAAVTRGYDLVILGPPGTGKSQTITNLVAEALGNGKTVLFVAEKMAALEVVHRRLCEAGLGEFCLEVHSTKASKRAVLDSIGAAMNAALAPPATSDAARQRLPAVRSELTDYCRAVHRRTGALARSAFEGYGELELVRDAPRMTLSAPIAEVTYAAYEATIRELDDLAAVAAPIGDPAAHPWRDATLTFYAPAELEELGDRLTLASSRTAGVIEHAARASDALGMPPMGSAADVEAAVPLAGLLAASPGAPAAVLGSDAWNTPPAEALDLIKRGREVVRLREHVASLFNAAVLERPHADDVAYVERKSEGAFSFLAILDARYRAIRKRWRAYRRASYSASMLEQADEMRVVDTLGRERAALAASSARAGELFGGHWHGEGSDWRALDAYVAWVTRFREALVRGALEAGSVGVAAAAAPDVTLFERLRHECGVHGEALAGIEAAAGFPAGYLAARPFAEARARIDEINASLGAAPAWAAFVRARDAAFAGLGREIADEAIAGTTRVRDASIAFRRAFWSRWLADLVRSQPALERFQALTHEERVREFRRLDRLVLDENRTRLIARLRDRTHRMLQTPEAQAELPALRRQIALQRRHAPLRTTMRKAGSVIRAIKPCFLMSPLSVAQLVEGETPSFDLVIFDEASQLPSEDAVGAIARGRQLAVVGDPKQLPPTNFFSVAFDGAAGVTPDDGTPVVDAESVLEEFAGSGTATSPLRWHYRSAHESLIQFSNVSFYDGSLYTFPSVERGDLMAGLTFEHVEDGRYEKGGLNMPEVRRVAGAIVDFAREQLARPAIDRLSLGVGTFNLRQQLAILDEIERLRRADPSLEPFFARGGSDPFFVKNLENIQGDERDVIFISVTYGKAADGILRYNFGPLNGQNGWRRLNVLVTRARREMRVFSSMRGSEMRPAADAATGAGLLKSFLHYAETGAIEGAAYAAAARAESPFEQMVIDELARRGLELQAQVGSCSYRIDIGVVDAEFPGTYLCGIECDGVSYHSSETARDRDRLRQQVLEARGWTIHRIWSTDWFKDREGQIRRILALIDETRRRARDTRHRPAGPHGPAIEVPVPAPEPDAPPERATPAYVRPSPPPYSVAPPAPFLTGRDVLREPEFVLVQSIHHITAHESPIREQDLVARVAALFGTNAGSRIRARISAVIDGAVRQGSLVREGEFVRDASTPCTLRSRAGTGQKAEQISPAEYRLAVLAVLQAGAAFSRDDLVAEVRSVFGYARASEQLRVRTLAAAEALLAGGLIGEGAAGLALRETS